MPASRDRILTTLLDWVYSQQLEVGLGSLRQATPASSGQLLMAAARVQQLAMVKEKIDELMAESVKDPDSEQQGKRFT